MDKKVQKIAKALLSGYQFTSSDLNFIGGTVDARKIISTLRKRGMDIQDVWVVENKIRYKKYYVA